MQIHGLLSHVTQKIWKKSTKKVPGPVGQKWHFLGHNRLISDLTMLNIAMIFEGKFNRKITH